MNFIFDLIKNSAQRIRSPGRKMGDISNFSGSEEDLNFILSRITRGLRRLTVRNIKTCDPKIRQRTVEKISNRNINRFHNDQFESQLLVILACEL